MTNVSPETDLAILKNDVLYIRQTVEKIQKLIEDKYVTKVEFGPIRNIVYGLIGVITLGVISALLTLVIR